MNEGYITTKTIKGSMSCYSIIELSKLGQEVLSDKDKIVKVNETDDMRTANKHSLIKNPIWYV
jgi:hypothetical protein